MAIIYCANCEGKVSDKLDNCPHCGHPVTAQGIKNVMKSAAPIGAAVGGKKNKVQTVEKTGKIWKFLTLVSVVMLIIGIIMAAAGSGGMGLIVPGLLLLIIARVLGWWFHG